MSNLTDDIKKLIIHDYTHTLLTIDDIATRYKTGRREVVGIVQYAGVFDTDRQKRVECNRLIDKIDTDNRFKLDQRVMKKLDAMKKAFERWQNEETDYDPVKAARMQLNYAVSRLTGNNARARKSTKIAIIQKYGIHVCGQISTKTDVDLENTIEYYRGVIEKTYSADFPQEDVEVIRTYAQSKILGCDNVLSGNLTQEELDEGLKARGMSQAEIDKFNAESEKQGWGSDHLRPHKGATGHSGHVEYIAPFVDRSEETLSY